ncbi:MAG TPA: nickel-responsive transcriptional regulator NikR [Firmicutes bacterium]|jgi:CopG family nickel-responsive transcriptional regulator|nr:nickel-responsive transcriptional regulator NikR [Bacillota bacterium]HAA35142.1 nickel-responsive transcriptional regulator NikR [Bacillota bacterium]
MSELIRFGVSISESLLEAFDRLIVKKGYNNRSEAIRDLIRNQMVEMAWEKEDEEVAGTVTLIYDHHVRGLSDLLLELQHNYHHLILSTMHMHLDHHNCLEVLAVKGMAREVRQVAEKLISVKGVKHGKLTITSTGKNLT